MPNGGGGGIVGVGNSFTGTAQTLELVGDHLYSYSGPVATDNTETTFIEATSGNYYLVGIWQPQMFEATGDDYIFKLYLNGSLAQVTMTPGVPNVSGTTPLQINLIIPSYTEVKITGQRITGSGTADNGALIVGRIYRG